jgi:hypothetical protein
MLKAKLVALCVCPAVLAPPVIIAVHRPARHAVAHLLQRAAHRLDDRVPAIVSAPATQYANIPCSPTLADAAVGGGGAPMTGGIGLASLAPADQSIYGDASRPGNGIGGGGFFVGGGGASGGGGFGGGGGGGSGGGKLSSGPILGPVSTPPATILSGGIAGMIPPSVGSTMGSVPEPATWALLVTGFGVVGAGLRTKRTVAA